jgi:hypothetical protein
VLEGGVWQPLEYVLEEEAEKGEELVALLQSSESAGVGTRRHHIKKSCHLGVITVRRDIINVGRGQHGIELMQGCNLELFC